MPIDPIITVEQTISDLSSLRFIDARGGEQGRAAYEDQHVRGAVWANLESDLAAVPEDAAVGGRHPLPDIATWAQTLGRWGIEPATRVVVYDDQNGANAAARVWWMLRAAGHRHVAILDGGWQAAVASSLPNDAEVAGVASSPPYPVDRWSLPTKAIDEVEALARRPDWRVLDVRAAARYRGETEPFDPVPGHIPGAVNLPLEEILDGQGRFKDATALRGQYERMLGTVPVEQLIVHCGSGVTACHSLVALERAGLDGAALYVGSYSEWCRTDRAIDGRPGDSRSGGRQGSA